MRNAWFPYNILKLQGQRNFYFGAEQMYRLQQMVSAAFRMIETPESELIVSSLTPTLCQSYTHTATAD